jgi:NTP pyrophosphatase (non-canonical NTP hydrolase)
MDFKTISDKAIEIRQKYHQLESKNGHVWTNQEIMEGFVGDVGDLMKLVMAKEGVRRIDDVDYKLGHELSDCLWCVLVLAKKYNIDLETKFMETMRELDKKISSEI